MVGHGPQVLLAIRGRQLLHDGVHGEEWVVMVKPGEDARHYRHGGLGLLLVHLAPNELTEVGKLVGEMLEEAHQVRQLVVVVVVRVEPDGRHRRTDLAEDLAQNLMLLPNLHHHAPKTLLELVPLLALPRRQASHPDGLLGEVIPHLVQLLRRDGGPGLELAVHPFKMRQCVEVAGANFGQCRVLLDQRLVLRCQLLLSGGQFPP